MLPKPKSATLIEVGGKAISYVSYLCNEVWPAITGSVQNQVVHIDSKRDVWKAIDMPATWVNEDYF